MAGYLQIKINDIQIQHLLKLNICYLLRNGELKGNSNTTLVKVKLAGWEKHIIPVDNSNTTLVKVKLEWRFFF